MAADPRGDRLQLMLTTEELRLLDDWRFAHRMPSRSAAVRELLRRGLAAEGFALSEPGSKSKDYGLGPNGGDHQDGGGDNQDGAVINLRGPRGNGATRRER
jgi:hypothetical protein